MGTNSFVNLPTLGVGYAATVLAATPGELSSFITLGPLTEGGYSDGQEAFVESLGMFYVLRPIVAPADGVTFVATSDDVTRQWVALNYTMFITASWPVANTRWYAVDGTNGDDTNVGYSDVSSADAGTKAKKTIAGLGAVFPRIGANRKVVIMIRSGTYADGLQSFLASVSGYTTNFPLVSEPRRTPPPTRSPSQERLATASTRAQSPSPACSLPATTQ